MDWFERLTGFRETSYDDTRAKLTVEGSRLRSLVIGKSYGIGELELVSLQSLCERVKSSGGLPGRLKTKVVIGDVRQMHQSPENAGALFQVASQFSLLEMTGPEVSPEDGVTRYQHDHTQGPACAIAAGAATIYRNYFAPLGGSIGQTRDRQFNGLADLGATLGAALNQPVETLWRMQNGYAFKSDFLDNFHRNPMSVLKLNHYPPQEIMDETEIIGVGGHCDGGSFTILWQDSLGGLEVRNKSGDWVGVPPIANTFVINIANLLQRWTNGRFSSTEHRVINRYGKDRYSIAFFVYPSHSTVIEPVVDQSRGEYEPVVCGEDMLTYFHRVYPQRAAGSA